MDLQNDILKDLHAKNKKHRIGGNGPRTNKDNMSTPQVNGIVSTDNGGSATKGMDGDPLLES